jgi:transposase
MGSTMLKDLDITPDDPAELRAVNRLLADEVKALRRRTLPG